MTKTSDNNIPFLPPMADGGGRVRIISPAGPVIHQEPLNAGCEILRQAGMEVIPTKSHGSGYLADSDHARLAELSAAVVAPDRGKILAARGGYGCQRLLPDLDLKIFADHPGVICGASDVSILLNFISSRTGLITFHTPMAIKLAAVNDRSRDNTIALLKGTLPGPPPPLAPFRGHRTRGRLAGGNLTVLTHLLGTPYAIPFAGRIAFFEDINEPVYRIDRMFQQLKQSGALTDVAAIVLGDFIYNGKTIDSEKIARLAAEIDAGCAIFTGLACGHGERNLPLPVGCECEIDDNGRMSFLYPQ